MDDTFTLSMVKIYRVLSGWDSREELDYLLQKVASDLAALGCTLPFPYDSDHLLKLWLPYLLVLRKKAEKPCKTGHCPTNELAKCSVWADDEPVVAKRGKRRKKSLKIKRPCSCTVWDRLYALTQNIFHEADDYVRRVSELCEIFGLKLTDRELSLESCKYRYMSLNGSLVKQFKYATNLVFCQFHNEVLPPSDPKYLGETMFPRRLQLRFRTLCTVNGRRRHISQVLMNSLFQGFKKGLLPMRPDGVQESMFKHKTALTQNPDVSEEIEVFLDRMLSVTDSPILSEKRVESRKLSRKATIESSYTQYGNIGWAESRHFALDYMPGITQLSQVSELDRILFYHHRLPRVEEFRGFVQMKRNSSSAWELVEVRSCFLTLKECFSVIPKELCESPSVVPAFILEPMKVRTITKPDAGLYSRFSTYQTQLWRQLRDHETGFFDLIGEPLQRSHLWRLFGEQLTLGQDELIVSGDYSAATDNLKGAVSKRVTEFAIRQLENKDPLAYMNIVRSMTTADVLQTGAVLPDYGDVWNYAYRVEDFTQCNGQLMGHVISFVILCLCNYLAYHLSWERYYNEQLDWWDVPFVLINGDDILFKSNAEHYKIWTSTVREFGFYPSVGKNFANRNFIQVNSELYRIDCRPQFCGHRREIDDMVVDLIKIPYVNFGLLTNRKKQDCTLDLSVKVFKRTELELIAEDESLTGRAAVLMKIKETLFECLPSQIRKRLEPLWTRHTMSIYTSFGMKWILGCSDNLQGYLLADAFGKRKENSLALGADLAFNIEMTRCTEGTCEPFSRLKRNSKTYKSWPFLDLCCSDLLPPMEEEEIIWRCA